MKLPGRYKGSDPTCAHSTEATRPCVAFDILGFDLTFFCRDPQCVALRAERAVAEYRERQKLIDLECAGQVN
jgi:hypothetical protein